MNAEPVDRRSLPRVLWDLYRTFGPHLRPYWRTFAVGYAAMGASVLTKTLTPFPLKWILDYVLMGKPLPEGAGRDVLAPLAGDAPALLAWLCTAMVALVFLQGLFSYFYRYWISSAARHANNDIRNHVFHRLQLLPMSFHGALSPGDLVVRLTDDVNTLRHLLVDSATELLKMVFSFGWVLALMAAIDLRLALLALAVAPPIYLLSARFRGRVEALARVTRVRESEVGAIVQENASRWRSAGLLARGQERRRFETETRAWSRTSAGSS
jgi:ABC-type multidrug transport system fused ATPase/permease subunit